MVRSDRTSDFLIEKKKHKASDRPQVMHFHPYYEIGLLLSGERTMIVDEKMCTMKRGDIIVIDKDAIHKGSMSDLEWVSVYVTETYIQMLMADYKLEPGIYEARGVKLQYMSNLLHRILIEKEKSDEYSEVLIRCYFTEFLVALIRHIPETEKEDISKETEKILEYIYNNYQSNLTLEDLARRYNMSISSFSKKFKKTTGCGFKEYLTNVRLKKAIEKLLQTDESITDIAMECGFDSANYFGDVFKKAKGVSPLRYRKFNGIY